MHYNGNNYIILQQPATWVRSANQATFDSFDILHTLLTGISRNFEFMKTLTSLIKICPVSVLISSDNR